MQEYPHKKTFGELGSSNSMQPIKLAVKSLLLIDILFKAATRNNDLESVTICHYIYGQNQTNLTKTKSNKNIPASSLNFPMVSSA